MYAHLCMTHSGRHHSTTHAPHLHCTAALHTHTPRISHTESFILIRSHTLRSSPEYSTSSTPSSCCCNAHAHATSCTRSRTHTSIIAHTHAQVITTAQHVLRTFIALLQCTRTRHILHTQSRIHTSIIAHTHTGHHHSTARAPHLYCIAALRTHPPRRTHRTAHRPRALSSPPVARAMCWLHTCA
jgi:hypothetical protein